MSNVQPINAIEVFETQVLGVKMSKDGKDRYLTGEIVEIYAVRNSEKMICIECAKVLVKSKIDKTKVVVFIDFQINVENFNAEVALSMKTRHSRMAKILAYTHKLLVGKRFGFEITDSSANISYVCKESAVHESNGHLIYGVKNLVAKENDKEVEFSVADTLGEKFENARITSVYDSEDPYDGEDPEEESDEELVPAVEEKAKEHLNRKSFVIAPTAKENLALLVSKEKTKKFPDSE